MLKNNNMSVVTRMARRSLKSNRRRSISMILAIFLAAFMLFSVLTVGATYFKMQRIQDMRISGIECDAMMYGVTREQHEMCEKNADIRLSGVCAVAGYVKSTERDQTPDVGLLWADENYWNKMKKPAMRKVEGSYPEKENEIMVTKKALKECGYGDLSVGDHFQMTYGVKEEIREETFYISGIWDGYGPKKEFYVSEKFYERCGYQLSDVASGRYAIDFKKNFMTQKEQTAFTESMHLEKQQALIFVSDFAYAAWILAGATGLILVTCLCAYLLIYNMMYLSVSGNVRYYGLLQTIGMSERQIRGLVRKQMFTIGGIGACVGILLGYGVAFFLIPSIVKSIGIRGGDIEIAFHPIILILTVLLVGVTVWTASLKPTKMAMKISPIEALRYRKVENKKRTHRTKRGNPIWRLAKEQLIKDKKKTGVVIISFSLSLSVFLCIMTLLSSQGARTYVHNYMEADLILKNDMVKNEEQLPVIDHNLLSEISKLEGVREVHPVYFKKVIVPWEPEFADQWMREFYDTWMRIPYEDEREKYKEHPEEFASSIVGIDRETFEYLNAELEQPVDEKAFLSGKSCIVYRNGLNFSKDDLIGKKVTCAEYENITDVHTFEIAGDTDEAYYTAILGYPPTIIVSDHVIGERDTQQIISKVSIFYDKEYDRQTEKKVLEIMQKSQYPKDFSYDSRIEELKEIEKAQGNMPQIGFGVALILAFIGTLNYINTSVGNIQRRWTEISVMESIGMSQKQVKNMLIAEGCLYFIGTWILTMTAGLAVIYLLYQLLNYRGVNFYLPVLPALVANAVMTFICISVPLITYQRFEKQGTIAERIREEI
ncbi:MAG: ABC transporter permease [Lachnospiraceae bacterium]|nr:ABC transporter permease [Lachnospiraceae bacterium]